MGKDLRDFYRSDRTCCLAVPLFHHGIYSVLALNTLFALYMGLTSFVGPGILSLVHPRGLSVAFGVLYFVVMLIHVASLSAIYRNRHKDFRISFALSTIIVTITLVLALVAIIISAANHSASVKACLAPFNQASALSAAAKMNNANAQGGKQGFLSIGDAAVTRVGQVASTKVCEIGLWVQVGVMFVAWLAVALVEGYFFSKQRVYLTLKMEDAMEDARF